MTDRIAGFVVVFEKDIREDDCEAIATAIRMLRGVAAVDPVQADPAQYILARRARLELGRKVIELIDEDARSS